MKAAKMMEEQTKKKRRRRGASVVRSVIFATSGGRSWKPSVETSAHTARRLLLEGMR
jgi:hypothetical protein